MKVHIYFQVFSNFNHEWKLEHSIDYCFTDMKTAMGVVCRWNCATNWRYIPIAYEYASIDKEVHPDCLNYRKY